MATPFKFIYSNRPEIGLVDRFDLSEIYTDDQRYALSNILLNPDGLDEIFNLAKDGLTKEDIRTMGGLDRPVIHSLGLSESTLSAVGFDLSQQITTDKAIGQPSKQSFTNNSQSDNVIVFHGGIAAKKIEYNFLDENGDIRTTTVPTSRESLFNSIKNAQGRYTTVSYPGLFRIRRRSHVNEIKIGRKLLLERGSIIESPTDKLNIPVYMRTPSNTSPGVSLLQCFATKNSPIVLPVKIFNSATISFSRASATSTSSGFVFGWELKRKSDLALVRSGLVNTVGAVRNADITINVTGTIGNGADCLLYVYLDASVITSARLAGIGLTEASGGQDIGLIGFNALKELDISGNNLSTIPTWLKTLHSTLERLNIRDNAFWNNGIVSFFDYQNLSGAGITGADTSIPAPNISVTQILGYSGWADTGKISAYDGALSSVQDKVGTLYINDRKNALAGSTTTITNFANGFRPFTKLYELNLGSSVRMVNPDFSKIFPALRTLVVDAPRDDSPKVVWGLIPKFNNTGGLMAVNISGHAGQLGGSIKYMGSTTSWNSSDSNAVKEQFIGQFKMTSVNCWSRGNRSYSGGVCTENDGSIPTTLVDGAPKYYHITSGSAAQAWSGWLEEAQYINFHRNDVALRLAKGSTLTWSKLGGIDINWAGDYGTRDRVRYNHTVSSGTMEAVDILNAPQMTYMEAFRSGWSGKMFSIRNAKRLQWMQVGANNWEGYIDSDGKQYLLPSNFVDVATTSSVSDLREFYLYGVIDGWQKDIELRQDDFKNLPRLTFVQIHDSFIAGKFPDIYTDSLTAGYTMHFWMSNSRFRDLSALGSAVTSRVSLIWAPVQGSGVGGALLPNFKSPSINTTLYYVAFNSSLSVRYSGNWHIEALRNKVIVSLTNGTAETTSPSVTWTSRNNLNTANATSEKLYHSAPGSYSPFTQVMVGDIVAGTGVPAGTRVTQIDRNSLYIYVNNAVTLASTTLTFTRAGQDITDYFSNHRAMDEIYMTDCRLTGSIPTFSGATNLRNVDFTNNLFTSYTLGTLKNITGVTTSSNATPRLRYVSFERNALSVQAVRWLISDMHDVAVYFAAKGIRPNIKLRILATKLNPVTMDYQNYQPNEIFTETTTTTNSGGDTITIPDPLEVKFNQMGQGRLYPGFSIELF
jgi:Leucine-rich repeat (LRR) protein